MDPITRKRLPLFILAATIVFNGIALWPDLSLTPISQNDSVSHFTLIQGMVEAIEHGRHALDFWSPEGVFGYPEIRTYQPLAHGIVVLLYFAFGKAVPLATLFSWVQYLSVVLLPASFFVAALLLGFPALTAAAAAALAPLLSTNKLYGIEYYSFVWSGFGLFPQAVAANLLLLAIGFGYGAIRQGKRVVLSGVLLGLTALAHLIYGYMGALTLCLLALLPAADSTRTRRIVRTLWVGTVAALLSAFQLLPLFLDRAIINHSNTEPIWKWDSWGANKVLNWLFTGQLLDYGRAPVLSVLALAGVVLIVWERRRNGQMLRAHLFVLSGATLWTLLFFGRPFWGRLLMLAAVSPDMHLHRVIGGLHIFLALLAAIGLAGLCGVAQRRWGTWAAVAAVLVLIPALVERVQFLEANASSGERALAQYSQAQPALAGALDSIRQRGGRTYAGLWNNWGKMFVAGSIHMYTILAANRVPSVSYLIHTMALPADLMGGFAEVRPSHFRLFDVRTELVPAVLAPQLPKFLTPRLISGPFALFDTPGGGSFDVVDAPVAVRTDKNSFFRVNEPWLRSAWVDKKAHLWLDFFGDAPPGLLHAPADGTLPSISFPATNPGRVIRERNEGETYQAEVEANRQSFALLKATWHQNWKAWVDGKPVKTVMLSPGFIGVPLAVGRHQVRCEYQPGGWKLPVALAGLFCVALLGLGERLGHLPGIRPTTLLEGQAQPITNRVEPSLAPAVKAIKSRRRKHRASAR